MVIDADNKVVRSKEEQEERHPGEKGVAEECRPGVTTEVRPQPIQPARARARARVAATAAGMMDT